jgi:hypothetical protein
VKGWTAKWPWKGATTLSITTRSITRLSINGLLETFSIMAINIRTLTITTLYHYTECRILFIVMSNVSMLSVAFHLLLCWMSLCWVWHFIYCYAECHYAKCCYPECHYVNCRYAQCCGALVAIILTVFSITGHFQLHSRKHFKNDRKMIARSFVNNIPETLKGQKMLWACVKQSEFLKL